MPAGQTLLYWFLMLLGGGVINYLISMLVYRQQRDDIVFRMNRIEQAFVSHTGITLNGKDYTKERRP